jgi:AmmeMemoRadiSam system protein B
MYSGGVAAHVYKELAAQETPETIVILSPNHTGEGSLVSLSNTDWETPLGVVETDKEIVDMLFRNCESLDLDETAHVYEHSLEVQLPFLQYVYGEFKMVPICMMWPTPEIIEEIAGCLAKIGKDALIIASSDFTHYESHESATKKDNNAISHILNMDEKRFLQTVYGGNLSICGHAPIATCIATAKKLRATDARLLKYATSGDVTGDHSQVVGYASIIMRR